MEGVQEGGGEFQSPPFLLGGSLIQLQYCASRCKSHPYCARTGLFPFLHAVEFGQNSFLGLFLVTSRPLQNKSGVPLTLLALPVVLTRWHVANGENPIPGANPAPYFT